MVTARVSKRLCDLIEKRERSLVVERLSIARHQFVVVVVMCSDPIRWLCHCCEVETGRFCRSLLKLRKLRKWGRFDDQKRNLLGYVISL